MEIFLSALLKKILPDPCFQKAFWLMNFGMKFATVAESITVKISFCIGKKQRLQAVLFLAFELGKLGTHVYLFLAFSLAEPFHCAHGA